MTVHDFDPRWRFICDPHDGVMHIRGRYTLAVCKSGFGVTTVLTYVENRIPTCLFCIAGTEVGLSYWERRGAV